MVLSQTAEYAVRLTYQLAVSTEDRRLRATELAERSGVPGPYVSKVLARLVKAGLVDGQKGHHGGFVLARGADDISLGDIFDAVEDWRALDRRCFFGLPHCRNDRPCSVHHAFAELKEDTLRWADRWSLGQLARGETGPLPSL